MGLRRVLAAGVGALLLSLSGSPVRAQPAPADEVMRLQIVLPSRAMCPGVELSGQVVLRRPGGGEARAPHPLPIRVESQLEGDAPRAVEVTIPEGGSRADFKLLADKPGLLRLRATSPEMLEAGTVVRCAPAAPLDDSLGGGGTAEIERAEKAGDRKAAKDHRGGRPITAEPSRTAPRPTSALGGRLEGIGARDPSATRPPPPPPPLPAPEKPLSPKPSPASSSDSKAPSPPATPSTPTRLPASGEAGHAGSSGSGGGKPHLTLRLSPQRPVLADGKDALSVLAFLDRAAPSDIKLNVFSTMGRLEPRPLLIARGDSEGSAQLTGQDPGDVEVELVGADPPATVDGDRKLKARFAAPVAALHVDAEPAAVTFVETGKVTVRLHDAQGRTVATDAARTVDLSLDRGHGSLRSERLTIEAGQSEASTVFEPTWPGPAGFSASSPSLFKQSGALRVTWPVGLLLISLLGGVVGGALALLRNRRQHIQRVVTGAVTGFVLYWAFIAGLLPVLPRNVVLNPLSVFALSTLGGWMGTEVFAMVLRKLGVIDAEGKGDKGKGESGGEGGDSDEEAADKPRRSRRKRAGGE